jgi:RNA polymerase sigma factor (sigma-70 family)
MGAGGNNRFHSRTSVPAMSHSSDRELLKACIEGDPGARDLFVERFSKLIYSSVHETLRMYSADFLREDIEDIHNNIFLSLFKDNSKKLRQFRGDNKCSVASWLRIIAINMSRNAIIRNRTFVSLDNSAEEGKAYIDALSGQDASVLDQLIDSEQIRLLNGSMDTLKADDRLIMKYYYKEELPPDEIAQIMNIAVNTVYSKISRIKKRLRRILESRNLLS